MIISVKIGYNSPIIFRSKSDAWVFINNVFNAAFNADNPENMPIEVEFKREEENEGTELRSDSSSETV